MLNGSKLYKIKVFKRKIGITGLRSSGKTAFLTSLINHLKHHDPERHEPEHEFFLEPHSGAKITHFQYLPARNGQTSFPYERYRNQLVEDNQWPSKTKDCSHYRCTFQRSDWRSLFGLFGPLDVELEFYDFPGDRLADMEMVETGSYQAWSERVLERFETEADYKEHASDFLKLIHQESFDESQIIKAYKVALARLMKQHAKAWITPSTFIVDTHGGELTKEHLETSYSTDDFEKLVEERFSGLSREEQFTPLPRMSKSKNKQYKNLMKVFRERYINYRKEIVLPVFKYLRGCHRLVVLVDVATLLTAGSGMYNDNQMMIEHVCKLLKPGKNRAEQTLALGLKILSGYPIVSGGLLSWKPKGISRMAFVASKSDRVHPDDRERLLGLVTQMVGSYAQDIEGAAVDYFTCSAIVSSKVINSRATKENVSSKFRQLAGFPVKDTSGNKLPRPPRDQSRQSRMKKLNDISIVPERWPDEWNIGDFTFYNFYPLLAGRKDLPPEQINLDKIFNFMLQEKLSE